MSGPDRPEPLDPAAADWASDDAEATRIVRRDPPPWPGDAVEPHTAATDGSSTGAAEPVGGDHDLGQGGTHAGDAVPNRGSESPAPTPGPQQGGEVPQSPPPVGHAAAPPWATTAGDPTAAGFQPGPPNGPGRGGADPTTVMPPYGSQANPASAPTSYLGAPTTVYPSGPGIAGPEQYQQQAGYSYQQPPMPPPGAAPAGSGPQLIPPPPTANVVLPPVRMPKAESRMALNLLGAVVGLLLVAGGLALLLLNEGKIHKIDTTDLGSLAGGTPTVGGTIDAVPLVLTIVGALLIAVAGLLSAWASWAPILPGVLLSAVSVWAMVTAGANGGATSIARGTRWAFSHGELALFCMSGLGLLVGLLLLAAGLAAVFLRAGVRRTIRQQLESIQA